MMHPTTIPQLSVVLPVYNAARFLRNALDSILDQDFSDFECVAINDGSTDESPSILEEYERRDVRLRVVHQPNLGLVDTLNRGIALSRAPLIARMDADDICLPGRFRTQMAYFRGRNDLGVLGGQIQLIDQGGQILRLVDYPAGGRELESFLCRGSPVAHPAVVLRKAAVEQVGLYRRAYLHAEDYDLWLRVHEAGYAIENVKFPLIGYRQHSGNVSVIHRRQQALATLIARCAQRARLAGLPDPTADLDRLDEQAFERFPAALIADLKDELFAVHLNMSSFKSEHELAQALVAFQRVPLSLQRTRSGTSFLMHAGRNALRLHSYRLAAAFIVRAFAIAPTEVASIGGRKAARLLSRLASRAILRPSRRPTSQRTPVD
jgi:glycosyltransferase involved in cell wall biosynthesis